jgi:hypothetical protein
MTYDPIDIASVYLATFVPRTDVYAVPAYRDDPEGRRYDGWRLVREELQPARVIAALRGTEAPLSGYLITVAMETHVFAYDFDLDDGASKAAHLGQVLAGLGIAVATERSRRGAHVWGVLDRPLAARIVRRAMRWWLEQAGLPTDEPKIELRPGQDTIAATGVGTPIRLPMMPHPLTGKRYLLCDASGAPLGRDTAEVLLALPIIPSALVTEHASRYWPQVDLAHVRGYSVLPRPPREPDEWDDASISEMLQDAGIANAAPGKAVRCRWHEDKVASLSILRDDRRCICRGSGCPMGGDDGRGLGTFQLHQFLTAA